MIERLFTSKVRVKLLSLFLLNEEGEYYVRELTRVLDEQINAVRRELENLKKFGLLKSKNKNRKKYYSVNPQCMYFKDLQSMFTKANSSHGDFVKKVQKFAPIEFLLLSGVFINKPEGDVDLCIVGDLDKEEFADFLDKELHFEDPIKFAIFSKDDFVFRIKCNDRFLSQLLMDTENIIAINKLTKFMAPA